MGGIIGKKDLSNFPTKNIYNGLILKLRNSIRYKIARATKNLLEHKDNEKIIRESFLGTVSVDMVVEYFTNYEDDEISLTTKVSQLKSLYLKIFGEEYVYKKGDEDLRP